MRCVPAASVSGCLDSVEVFDVAGVVAVDEHVRIIRTNLEGDAAVEG